MSRQSKVRIGALGTRSPPQALYNCPLGRNEEASYRLLFGITIINIVTIVTIVTITALGI